MTEQSPKYLSKIVSKLLPVQIIKQENQATLFWQVIFHEDNNFQSLDNLTRSSYLYF